MGFRQGDPLSLYLFYYAQSVSTLLQHAEQAGRLRGVSICRGFPSISHLIFADDTLIFFRASPESAQVIREVLEVYCLASRQEINFTKSSMAFSRNMDKGLCLQIMAGFSIRQKNKMELCLGLSLRAAHSKKEPILGQSLGKDNSDWNDHLVHELFWTQDNNVILGIPLSRLGDLDLLVWHYSRNGMFSVRNIYHFACSLQDRLSTSSLGEEPKVDGKQMSQSPSGFMFYVPLLGFIPLVGLCFSPFRGPLSPS
ncbi:hypothetical protein Sango_2791700 [Sesamum angolense]|uniref:Reverse transcriptase domain-containing protein n=1 Tax=Sesamum angolense TaxID=2727404 RepID=A0AAE1VX27_9LAMI|nr:hypothetical protein Sango_2791700 [Sesamum angolense]